jgi:ABC-type Mn2+/Zn2+ transport system ATPase subunit
MTDCATVRDLALGYHSLPAIQNLDESFRTGSLTALVGANSLGKSTLLKGIAGMLKPMFGSCSCSVPCGMALAYLPQQCGRIPGLGDVAFRRTDDFACRRRALLGTPGGSDA